MRTITLTLAGAPAQVFSIADDASAEETRAAIQSALDQAANTDGGGSVILSEGVFTVAARATAGDGALRVGSNTEFAGAGLGLSVVKLAESPGTDVTGIVRTDSGRTNADGTPTSTHNVLIRDLSIDGNKANTGTTEVDGFFCGPKPFTETAIDSNIRLERVEVANVSRYGFDPHERTDNLVFVECVARDNTFDGFTIDYCTNVTLIDCETFGNGRHGVNIVTSTRGVVIEGLISRDNGGTGLVIQTGSETRILSGGAVVTGGRISNNKGDGITVREADNVTIGGDGPGDGIIISDNGRFGVLLEGASEASLIGNTLTGNNLGSGMGSDDTQIRIRGYLQTHLDLDADNDTFVLTNGVVLRGNTVGTPDSTTHDYGYSYSDTQGLAVEPGNVFAFAISESIADTSKLGTTPLDTMVVTKGDDTITGTAGRDVIAGDTGNDVILGLGGDDTLYGSDGHDTLIGGAGADILAGGFGNDTYVADAADTIAEVALGGGEDWINTEEVNFTLAALAAIENLTFTGSGNFTGTGNSARNVMTGGAGNDQLNGAAGDDTLAGGEGNDRLNGGTGGDAMNGGGGDDTYIIDHAADGITDSAGLDTVLSYVAASLAGSVEILRLLGTADLDGSGNALNNHLYGNAGNNVLNGYGGDDVLNGGAGRDTLAGGLGNDTYIVERSDEIVNDAGGIDRVVASADFVLAPGLEVLQFTGSAALNGSGNGSANTILGNAGANILRGLSGDDVISGGGGNDIIAGGAGADRLLGGSGYDVFRFDAGATSANADRIVDFSVAGDTIELSRTVFRAFTTTGALAPERFVTASAAIDSDDEIVYNAATGALYYDPNGNADGAAVLIATLAGRPLLSAGDFVIIP